MGINEEAFLLSIKGKLTLTWHAVHDALENHLENGHRMVYRSATEASARVDLIYDQMVSAFVDYPECGVAQNDNNSRYFRIAEGVLLWFKKVDSFRRPSNLRTNHNLEILNGEQEEMFPQTKIVVVGYLLNPETSLLQRLSFAPPTRPGHRPEWFFDIMQDKDVQQMPRSIEIVETVRRKSRLMLIHGEKQQEL